MTISTIVLPITGVFGGGGRVGGFPPKDEGTLINWLNRLADALKRPVGNAVKALLAIVGRIVRAILSLLGAAVRFADEHTWILFVFIEALFGIWLIQNVKNG